MSEYESEFAAPPYKVIGKTIENGEVVTRVDMEGEVVEFVTTLGMLHEIMHLNNQPIKEEN